VPIQANDCELEELWRLVEERVPRPAAEKVKTFLRFQNVDERWLSADLLSRLAIRDEVSKAVDDLHLSGLLGSQGDLESTNEVMQSLESVKEPGEEKAAAADARWSLWRQLMSSAGIPDWREIRLRRVYQLHPGGFPRVEHRVEIDIDERVSFEALKKELKRLWRDLGREGWIKRTRSLSARNIELARFVCLESPPGTTWEQRWEVWNEEHKDWEFSSPWTLESQVRRIEQQLTGLDYGLAWFYDTDARNRTFERMKPAELAALPPRKRERARRLLAAATDPLLQATNDKLRYAVALRQERASPEALASLVRSGAERSETTVMPHGAIEDVTIDSASPEEVDDVEAEVRDLGLEGQRLPRTDLGEWVWRTPYDHLFRRRKGSRPEVSSGESRGGER
jgi:hypothetical protein